MASMMGQAAMQGYYDPTTGAAPGEEPNWGVWAAAIMVIAGALGAIRGVIAIVNDDWTVWDNPAAVYLDLTAWGWVHLVFGLAVLLSGLAVRSGNLLARAVGIVAATCDLVIGFMLVPVQPFWSLITMVLDVIVIWALTVRGDELAASR